MAYKKSKKSVFQEVAKNRIDCLLDQILTTEDKEFCKNCAKLISRICLRYNIRLEKEEKIFCKSCFSCFNLEKPKIRTKTIKKDGQKYLQKRIICPNCNKIATFNYKK